VLQVKDLWGRSVGEAVVAWSGKILKESEGLPGGGDGIRYTRERIARLTEVVKCFAMNGRNWRLNGY
jgi:hypothetical protein